MNMRRSFVIGAVFAVAPALVGAQPAAPPPAGGAAPPASAPAPAPATGEASELNLALETRADGYTYNPQGRRDPFINLLKSVAGKPTDTVRPSGIAGFVINEVH